MTAFVKRCWLFILMMHWHFAQSQQPRRTWSIVDTCLVLFLLISCVSAGSPKLQDEIFTFKLGSGSYIFHLHLGLKQSCSFHFCHVVVKSYVGCSLLSHMKTIIDEAFKLATLLKLFYFVKNS